MIYSAVFVTGRTYYNDHCNECCNRICSTQQTATNAVCSTPDIAVYSPGCRIKCRFTSAKQKSLGITIRYIHYHNLNLIRSPPLVTSFLHRSGISAILARISSDVLLSHSSKITCFSSSIVRQSPYRFLTRCFRIFQIPSLGFRSGDYAGWRSVLIEFASFSFRVTLFSNRVPWDESLSS